MPQLNPDTFSPQLVWLAISFVVLYLLMWRVALPKVARVLDERQARINHDLESAAKLKAEAEAARDAYEAALRNARLEAQEVARQMADTLTATAAAQQTELNKSLAQTIAEAEARIQTAKEEALGSLETIAAEVAHDAVKTLVGTAPTAAKLKAAVGAAAKERRA